MKRAKTEGAPGQTQAKRAPPYSPGGTDVARAFLQDESGLEMSEYAVAAALITLALILTFTALGTSIKSVITNLAGKIS